VFGWREMEGEERGLEGKVIGVYSFLIFLSSKCTLRPRLRGGNGIE